MVMEQLSNAIGVSGDEGEVRRLIRSQIEPYCDKIEIDTMGNLYAYKKGASGGKTIMLAAHMDEVGFIVSSITDSGYLKFKSVGGIDPRVIVGKRVVVGPNRINGVIALRAIHLQTAKEREAAVEEKNLYIDIGAADKDDAEKQVDLGDYVAFVTEFAEFGQGLYKGKALDDRAGCAVLMDLLKQDGYPYDIIACFTVQEEVGCRGAQVAANKIRPDLAIVIECTICADVAGAAPHQEVTTLGGGGALTIMDRATYADKALTRGLYEFGKANHIPVQYKRSTKGGNDAAAIHQSGEGIPCAAIAMPCRYLHSPVSVISKADCEAVYRLVCEYLKVMGNKE